LESRSAKSGSETVAVPFAWAWKTKFTSVPDPETPPAPGALLRVTETSPVSFIMFFDIGNNGFPSELNKPPGVTSFKRRTFGSN
jgi:hypothetical protein